MALIIFDLDHTLIEHSDDTYYHIFNRALKHFGIDKVSPGEYEHLRNVWNAETIEDAYNIIENAFKIRGADFFNIIDLSDPELHKDMIKKGLISVFDDVLIPLQNIRKKGHKIAIVTNSSKLSAKSKIKIIGKDLFDVVITKDDVDEFKPNPEPLLKAIKIVGIDKKDVIFVGDSEVDKIAAQRAGVKFFLIDRENGKGDIDTLHGFDKLIDNEN